MAEPLDPLELLKHRAESYRAAAANRRKEAAVLAQEVRALEEGAVLDDALAASYAAAAVALEMHQEAHPLTDRR